MNVWSLIGGFPSEGFTFDRNTPPDILFADFYALHSFKKDIDDSNFPYLIWWDDDLPHQVYPYINDGRLLYASEHLDECLTILLAYGDYFISEKYVDEKNYELAKVHLNGAYNIVGRDDRKSPCFQLSLRLARLETRISMFELLFDKKG